MTASHRDADSLASDRTAEHSSRGGAARDEAAGRAMIVSHGVWSLIGKLTNLLVAFLNTALVARLLTPEEFADLNSLRTLMMLFAIGLSSGLAQNALRHLGRLSPDQFGSDLPRSLTVRAVTRFGVASTVVAMLAFAVVLLARGRILDSPLPVLHIAVTVAGIVLIGLSELISELHRGLGIPGRANFLGGTKGAPAATLIFVTLLSVAHFTGAATFLAANCLFVASTLIVIGCGSWSLHQSLNRLSRANVPVADPAVAADQPSDSMPRPSAARIPVTEQHPAMAETDSWLSVLTLSAAFMISFAILQGDLLMAASLPEAVDSAGYVGARRCIQLVSIPLMVVNTMASGVITPLLVSGRKPLLEKTLRAFCGAAAVPAAVLCLAFACVPEWSLRLILGDGYETGATALRILVVGQLVYVLSGSCGMMLSLCGCRRAVLVINAASLLALIVLAPPAGQQYGSTGLACVLSAILAINNVVTWVIAWKLTGVNTWCSLAWLLRLRSLLQTARLGRVRPGGAGISTDSSTQ